MMNLWCKNHGDNTETAMELTASDKRTGKLFYRCPQCEQSTTVTITGNNVAWFGDIDKLTLSFAGIIRTQSEIGQDDFNIKTLRIQNGEAWVRL